MSAIQDALSLYGTDFPRVHGMYLEHGYCYSEPTMLALARPCNSKHVSTWITDVSKADAWWIELVVGEYALGTLFEHIPFPLPLIGWMRAFKGKPTPRFYNFNTLKEKLNHGR